jgi:hypothetical protein
VAQLNRQVYDRFDVTDERGEPSLKSIEVTQGTMHQLFQAKSFKEKLWA